VTCSIPGMCSRSAACPDRHCPGHPGTAYTPGRLAPLTPEDLDAGQRALHVEDGGTWFLGHRVLRLHPRKPEPTESATERSDTLGWIALVIAAAAALAVVLAQLPF
jgi:hypothetical protein